MSLIFAGIFLFLAILSLSITGGFITHSTSDISNIPNYKNDPDLSRAYTLGIWASVLTWITVAVVIILTIVYFVRSKNRGIVSLIILYILFFISLVIVLIVTILSIITASDINKSNNKGDTSSHNQATWAAVLGSLTFVALIVSLIFAIYSKHKDKITKVWEIKKGNREEIPNYEENMKEIPNYEENMKEIPNYEENMKEIPNYEEKNNKNITKNYYTYEGKYLTGDSKDEIVPIQTASGDIVSYNRDLGKRNARKIANQFGVEVPDWLYNFGEKAVLRYMQTQR